MQPDHVLWNYPAADLVRGGIYRIFHTPTNREYIGSTWCFATRWPDHCSGLRYKNHHTKKLENSWHFHGEQEFRFEIIEFVDGEDTEYLKSREQYYFDTRKPYYNSLLTAAGKPFGRKALRRKSHGPPVAVPARSEGILNSPVIDERRKRRYCRILERMVELGWGTALPDQPLTTSARTIAPHTNMTTGVVYHDLQDLIEDGTITCPRSVDVTENDLQREKTNSKVLAAMIRLGWSRELPPAPMGALAEKVADEAGIYRTVSRRSLERMLASGVITCPSLAEHMPIPHRTRITEIKILEAMRSLGWETTIPGISFKTASRRIAEVTGLHTEVAADGMKRLLKEERITCVNPPGTFGNEARQQSTNARILEAMQHLGWGAVLPIS